MTKLHPSVTSSSHAIPTGINSECRCTALAPRGQQAWHTEAGKRGICAPTRSKLAFPECSIQISVGGPDPAKQEASSTTISLPPRLGHLTFSQPPSPSQQTRQPYHLNGKNPRSPFPNSSLTITPISISQPRNLVQTPLPYRSHPPRGGNHLKPHTEPPHARTLRTPPPSKKRSPQK